VASRAVLTTCFHAGIVFGLFYEPEDGGDTFLRNVGSFNGEDSVISQKKVLFTVSVSLNKLYNT
jgi:hypothetical protein